VHGSKKKQRLDLQGSSGGRGKGRGKKQQQQGGRGRGKGRNNQQQQQHVQGYVSAADLARQAARSARFGGNAAGMQLAAYGWEDDGSQGDGGFIVGTCQKLEKGYLRLTRPPAPDEVRPQPVLAAALRRLLGLIESKADKYLYYNDQFKAMRQDLTVQGIKSDFTVQVRGLCCLCLHTAFTATACQMAYALHAAACDLNSHTLLLCSQCVLGMRCHCLLLGLSEVLLLSCCADCAGV
jgi:hypothetical protein